MPPRPQLPERDPRITGHQDAGLHRPRSRGPEERQQMRSISTLAHTDQHETFVGAAPVVCSIGGSNHNETFVGGGPVVCSIGGSNPNETFVGGAPVVSNLSGANH